MKIYKLFIVFFLLINNIYPQEALSYITGVGKNIHQAQRFAMNAVRTHGLKVSGQHTQINSDGTAIVVLEVRPRKIHCPVANLIKD